VTPRTHTAPTLEDAFVDPKIDLMDRIRALKSRWISLDEERQDIENEIAAVEDEIGELEYQLLEMEEE